MSGGSYDYKYMKVEELADEIEEHSTSPTRKAFAKHLRDVANACHDIEWVDSGDYGPGDEEKSIRKCLGNSYDVAIAMEAMVQMKELKKYLDSIFKEKK